MATMNQFRNMQDELICTSTPTPTRAPDSQFGHMHYEQYYTMNNYASLLNVYHNTMNNYEY